MCRISNSRHGSVNDKDKQREDTDESQPADLDRAGDIFLWSISHLSVDVYLWDLPPNPRLGARTSQGSGGLD